MFSSSPTKLRGFTLIELSVVLVIIGLIVGGVLVGRDLIKASEIRSAISQLEQYTTAANTFRTKYNGLPGDLINYENFGFVTTGRQAGQNGKGDGDGLIESEIIVAGGHFHGETKLFWKDLADSKLLSDRIISTTGFPETDLTSLAGYLPASKLGNGNYFHAIGSSMNQLTISSTTNFFTISAATGTDDTWGIISSGKGIKPKDAYNIDSKIDDGSPLTGKVAAIADMKDPYVLDTGSATPVAGTCFNSTPPEKYFVSGIASDSVGCALRIKGGF